MAREKSAKQTPRKLVAWVELRLASTPHAAAWLALLRIPDTNWKALHTTMQTLATDHGSSDGDSVSQVGARAAKAKRRHQTKDSQPWVSFQFPHRYLRSLIMNYLATLSTPSIICPSRIPRVREFGLCRRLAETPSDSTSRASSRNQREPRHNAVKLDTTPSAGSAKSSPRQTTFLPALRCNSR